MKNLSLKILLILFVISFFLLTTCEKQEYDLFPLRVGNEFYYTYSKSELQTLNINGTERWKVISISSRGPFYIYTIERKLDGTLMIRGQIKTITDSLRFFEISESKSTSLLSTSPMLTREISFKRYQYDPMFEIKYNTIPQSHDVSWGYLFKADSGLTKYTYYHPPNQIVYESLLLDSLKIIR